MATTTSDQQNASAEEQSTDQAGAGDSGVEEESAGDSTTEEEGDDEGAGTEDEEPGEVDLIDQKTFDSLKGDPAKLRAELNRAATRKFQQLSRERKELRPYANLIRSLGTSPKETVAQLAEQFGIEIVQPKSQSEAQVEDVGKKINARIREALGPDYEDLADRLSPAIQEAASLVAGDMLKATNERLLEVQGDVAMQEANTALATFAKRHPDWNKHEDAMTQLSERMPPGPNTNQVEYLENLYYLVTRNGSEGDGVKKILKKMTKSARETSSGKETAVDSSAVSITPGKLPSFRDAYQGAKRGERFE